jgi:hypothetical protein
MIPLQQIERSNPTIWWKILPGLSLFCFSVIGPWLWFQSRTRLPEDQFFLSVRREVPGWRFSPVALDTKTRKTLEASELFNGHFLDARSNRVSVFAADWQPGQGDLDSLGHTPEKCWVGTGFQIVPFGGPSQLSISVGGRLIPFQCRVLRHSHLAAPEITIWVACIDGQYDGIPYLPPLQQIEDSHYVRVQHLTLFAAYKNLWPSFCERVLVRSNQAARKQLIRLSAPMTTEWQTALVELAAFANHWLEPY